MIIFPKNGRLGNQFFQVQGIQEYFPKEKIFFIGFNEFFETFRHLNDPKVVSLNLNRYHEYFLRKLIKYLIFFRIVGKVSEESRQDSFEIIRTRGILYNIVCAEDVFFQNKIYLNKMQSKYSIQEQHKKDASDWLKSHSLSPANMNIVFVHIRRGDYLLVPSKENPAVVTLKWIESTINYFYTILNDPKFIIMGDDKMYLDDFFLGKNDVIVSKNSHSVDLTIMSECKYGILSASSFSLTGALLAKFGNDTYMFVAPKYWMGNKVGTWIPIGVETNWINYCSMVEDENKFQV
jgi:hypothetical protein